MKTRMLWVFIAIIGCTLGPLSASASLVGDTVTSILEAPVVLAGDNLWDGPGGATTATPIVAVVGAGTEYSFTALATFSADLGAHSLSLGIFNPVAPIVIADNLVYDFFDLDFTSGSIVLVLLTSSDFTGVTMSWTSDSIHAEIPNQVVASGFSSADFTIVTQPLQVPEPGALGFVGLGLVALVMTSGRRKRS